MKNLHLFFVLLLANWNITLAQNVDCDTVPVMATASAGYLTCTTPFANITGGLNPSVLSYQWSGPGGFTSSNRVETSHILGVYTLTVTGLYGCTAQTTVQIVDSCLYFPLPIPACPVGMPAPFVDECSDICVSTGLDGYQGTNAGLTHSAPLNVNCNLVIHNDGWLAFVAGSPTVEIDIISSNCAQGDGLQTALLDECMGTVLAADCGTNGGAGIPLVISATDLIPGKVYYLVIDGFTGDVCDFTINELIPNCTAPPDTTHSPLDPLVLHGPSTTCSNATEIYYLTGSSVASAYLWTGPPGSTINGLPSPVAIVATNGSAVEVTFTNASSGYVCVRELFYNKPPSPPLCKQITFTNNPLTILPDVTICFGEVYELPWGESVSVPGIYAYGYIIPNGCDSVVRQKVIVIPPIVVNLGAVSICPGACIDINGESFCQPGVYTFFLTSWQGCDSVVSITLQNLYSPDLTVSNTTINCITPIVMPTASSSIPGTTFEWLPAYPTGPGSYQVIATAPNGCSNAVQFVIEADLNVPTINAMGGTLTCVMPEIVLMADFSPSNSTVIWYGPGTQFAGSSVPASMEGIYTAVVTGINGCTSQISVPVVDSCIVSVPQGLHNDLSLQVFPNPADAQVRLEANDLSAFDAITVWSPDGRLVLEQKFSVLQRGYDLDLSTWYSGTYRLMVHSQDRWTEIPLVVLKH